MVKNSCLTLLALLLLPAAAAAAPGDPIPLSAQEPAVSTGAAPAQSAAGKKAAASNKDKSLSALVKGQETKTEVRQPKTIRIFKGREDGAQVHRLTMPPEAHWRVLWKIDVLEKKDKASIKLQVRSVNDKSYEQGLQKHIIKDEESAFGVINVCYEGGGEFTLAFDPLGAKWDIQVQQLQ